MTVADLIAKLQTFEGQLPVTVEVSSGVTTEVEDARFDNDEMEIVLEMVED